MMKKLMLLAGAAGTVVAIAAPAAASAAGNTGACTLKGAAEFWKAGTQGTEKAVSANLTGTPTELGYTFKATTNCTGEGALSGAGTASAAGTGLLSCTASLSGLNIAGSGSSTASLTKGNTTIGGELDFVGAAATVDFLVKTAEGAALGSVNFITNGAVVEALEPCGPTGTGVHKLAFEGALAGSL